MFIIHYSTRISKDILWVCINAESEIEACVKFMDMFDEATEVTGIVRFY